MTFLAGIAAKLGIKGGIIAALLLALGFTMWRADTFSDRLERQVQATANERAAHAVTLASLAQLEQRLAVFVKEGEQRTRAAQEALAEQRGRSAALGEQIDRIRAQRPSAGEIQRCETPAVVRGAWGL